MKVLLISTSARGHAIAEALSRSRHRPEITAISPNRNPGIAALTGSLHIQDVMDFPRALEIAKKERPDLAIIGPEDPIGNGFSNLLEAENIPTVAPWKDLARIESSKGFSRSLLHKHGIDASPRFSSFNRAEPEIMSKFIEQYLGGKFVVKFDGLLGGKGVKVSGEHLDSKEDGVRYAIECIEQCGSVVIEEKLVGCEFSLMSFVSGKRVVHMPAVQDHKRAYEGDSGPNTGGMGSYSGRDHGLPFLNQSEIERAQEINQLTAHALMKECHAPYRGILYGGFMATADGVKVIEFNCRFGDPEALNVLPMLKSDFVDICLSIVEGTLEASLVQFANRATVCKYITPDCYPVSKDRKGEIVTFPEIPKSARIFFGDVSENEDEQLVLGGSRTAGIVGIGDSLAEAERIAQGLCEKVEGPVRFRSDIGKEELVQKRISTMQQLRSRSAAETSS